MAEEKEPLEERGAKASKEIAEVLKKYHLALAVDIAGAKDFVKSLKPTLVEAPDEKAEPEVIHEKSDGN